MEPGPAKVAVTSSSSSSIPSAEKVPPTKSTLWQEEMRAQDQPDGSSLSPAQSPSQSQPPVASSLREPGLESREEESTMSSDRMDCGRKVRVESGYFSLEKTKQDLKAEEQQLPPPLSPPSPSTPNNRRSQVIEKFEALDIEKAEHMETNASAVTPPSSDTRQGRSEKRAFPRRRDLTSEAPTAPLSDATTSPLSPHRRAKSLDRRSTESPMTPDLLNFKKGWLTKQYEEGQWKKHWFVLADQSLRYYRDSVAEEAADLDGEIDLSTCYDVTEYPVQRNYGFQIHTKEGAFTLSAMTSGIRRNWIQTIMKHVHPATAPDVTSSLPEEKSKSSSPLEACPRPSDKPEAEPGEPDPELKRSRARERRREGRSKTFDWAEFRPIQQALAQERAARPPNTQEPGHPEAEPGELERERARRREERRRRFGMLDTPDGVGAEDAALRMEIDRSPGLLGPSDLKAQNVHVEIEQRWHQVETTPLREEKQVPIAPLHLPSEDGTDRLSTHELTSLLEKELEQSQKEASDLLEQNRLLQDQLRVALGREQSAREGYVLQTEVATSPSGAWQRLHKVNQDLQRELEAQCQRQELITQQIQTLKRSYGEAKDAIRHHEAEIRSLQARLSNAAAELAIKEQALAKLKGDLKLEQGRVREQLEERQQREAVLSAQLRASEQKLQSAEALLLERTQELRGLETQQALQRDRQKEVQRLQERVAALSQQLGASEQAQRLMEEKLQSNYALLLQSCEEEKRALLQSLKELEDKASAYEDQLQGHAQQVEALEKEKLSARCEGSEQVHQLEQQLEARETSLRQLAEHAQHLREERDLSRQRLTELTERVAASHHDVAALQEKLSGREADYESLERSYHSVSEQLQSAHTLLRQREEELQRIKDAHEGVLQKKEQELREALVKVVALGSSLEETEIKLQAKEEILRKFAEESSGALEDREQEGGIALPGQQHPAASSTPSGFPHARLEDEAPAAALGDEGGDGSPGKEEGTAPPKSAEVSSREGHVQSSAKPDAGAAGGKRQRIRFSTIQCQKYVQPEGSEKTWTSSTSSDTSQERSPSEESVCSEAAPGALPAASDAETYLSIIHSLETKLYVTEEKLKDVTLRLESQQGQSREALLALHQQWAGAEAQLREQLRASLLQVGSLAAQLEQERRERASGVESHVGELGDFQVKNSQALSCLESCREQLRLLPRAGQDKQDAGPTSLAGMESALVSVMQALQPWPGPADSGVQAWLEERRLVEGGAGPPAQGPQPELSEQQQVKLLSDQIALEASLISQIADSLKSTTLDVSRVLSELSRAGELSLEAERGTHLALAPAEAWARKVLVDGEFWSQVESLRKHLGTLGGEAASVPGGGQQHVPQGLAEATWVRAELSFATQSVRESFQHRLQSVQETLQGTQRALRQHKCMLGEILRAYQTPDFERVVQRVSEALGPAVGSEDSVRTFWELSPSEALGPDTEGTQEPLRGPQQNPQALVAIQEELAQQLKEKARLLEEISAALPSLPPWESLGGCRRLLQASHELSYSACLGGLGQYSSLLVQDAIVQAQVCYAACKIRLEYERELRFYRESWQSGGTSCQEQALREEYEELLHKQKSEYLQLIAIIERENAELKARASQLGQQQAESERSESTPPQGSCVAEHSRVGSQLGASARDSQDLERHHGQQMQTLEDRFQLKVKELQTIHQEELRALQEHYSHSLRHLQETLGLGPQPLPEALPPPGATWPAQPAVALGEADSMTGLRERIQELEAQMDMMREELGHKELEGDTASLREKYQRDLENLKVSGII